MPRVDCIQLSAKSTKSWHKYFSTKIRTYQHCHYVNSQLFDNQLIKRLILNKRFVDNFKTSFFGFHLFAL
jgi:arsenate reductase-like glutaredoxin family protein